MNSPRCIELRGGSEHNLQSIDVDIPLHQLTVVCGVSGSGKTSLALDTLYAEGQRRYIESFSAYTRQFLARIEKPRYTRLDHLPPSLAVTRGGRTRNNRSTVGTASELLEPLRILFSLIAEPHCVGCGARLYKHTAASIGWMLEQLPRARSMLAFDLDWANKADLAGQLAELQSAGFIRVLIGDAIHELSQERSTWAKRVPAKGSGFVIVERFQTGAPGLARSLQSALELALDRTPRGAVVLREIESDAADGEGAKAFVREVDGKRYAEMRYARGLRCSACDLELPDAEPRLFSFNSPIGACPDCTGFGEVSSVDMDKVVPDRNLSLRDGAIAAWRTPAYEHELHELLALAGDYELPVDVPVSKLTRAQWKVIEQGVPARKFGGLNGFFAWLERKKYKLHVRAFLSRWKTYKQCATCDGLRLSKSALAYRHEGAHFAELTLRTVESLKGWVEGLENALTAREDWKRPQDRELAAIRTAIQEVRSRLDYLSLVGLDYLTLSRTLHTLSGGESQRVALTSLLGSDLVDMLYVLDEPTVGLHPTDTERVASAIERLVDRGNTVVLIEHEPFLLFHADHVLEIGPGAGVQGGTVCFSGSPKELKQSKTLTAKYLFGKAKHPNPRPLVADRNGTGAIELIGACGRNLKQVDVRIPLGGLVVVVGVSGSGKSSLILDTLVPALSHSQGDTEDAAPGLPFQQLRGERSIDGCVAIDQSPIAKSIRSSPATYTKVMDEIRSLFGSLPDTKLGKMTDSHFSFNSAAGRCPACEGLGFTVVDMQFMADVRLPCTDCQGRRFRPEVLAIRYRDRSIAEVLEMSVEQARDFFRGQPRIQSRLAPLIDIGLGYLPLGQSVSSLSAGESMRLKLAAHLGQQSKQLIVMDEPTTGLHFADVDRLVDCLDVLIAGGNSLLVIEHNEQLIRRADYVIELGPGAGPAGGTLLFSGPRDAFFQRSDTPTSRSFQREARGKR